MASGCRCLASRADAAKHRAILAEMAEVLGPAGARRPSKGTYGLGSANRTNDYVPAAIRSSMPESMPRPFLGNVLARKRYVFGEARPYLRHLQHRRLRLRVRGGRARFPNIARQTSDTHAPAPYRRSSPAVCLSQRDTGDNVPMDEEIIQRDEAVELSGVRVQSTTSGAFG